MGVIILIANIITFIGSVLMILVGLLKKKEQMLVMQCVQCTLMGIGNLMLGGITGLISNVVTVIRNLISFKWKFTWVHKVIFIVIQIFISLFSDRILSLISFLPVAVPERDMTIVSWLPVLAAVLFTIFLDTKSAVKLKVVMIISLVMWLIYDFTIRNYSSMVFDVLSIITSIIGIIMIYRKKDDDSVKRG